MDKNLDKELGQVLSRVFLLQSHLSKFARGTWTRNLDNCGLPCYKLSQYYAPIPGRPRFRVPRPGGNPNLDKNLDKELGQILSRVFLLQSHLSKFARGTWTRNLDNCGLPCYKLSQYYAPIPGRPRFQLRGPGRKPELGQELGQGTWTSFITCFPLAEPLVQVRPGNLDKELGQLRAAVLQALSVLRPDSRQAPIPCASPLSLEGVSQMDSILPERLPALVRPAFDLVLRRIRSLKRCVQACGCKIMTPRYAPQFGSRLHFKRCQPLLKETPFPFFSGTPFFGTPFFLFFFFWFFLSPAKVGSLEMQPGAKLQAYLGVIILQPHACAQRFRLRILRRTRSNAGRTSAGSLSGRIESIWETPSKERELGATQYTSLYAIIRTNSKTCCPPETRLGPSMWSTLKGLVGEAGGAG